MTKAEGRRQRVADVLGEGPQTWTHISARARVGGPNLDSALMTMMRAGAVVMEKDGPWWKYRLAGPYRPLNWPQTNLSVSLPQSTSP